MQIISCPDEANEEEYQAVQSKSEDIAANGGIDIGFIRDKMEM